MHRQLKLDAVRGFGWAFFSSTSVRLLQIIATLALAKLLTPADFGVFALASIVTTAMVMLPDIGFAQALIYEQGDIRKSANTAFILSAVTGGVLAVCLLIAAPLMGRLFNEPLIVMPIRVMGSTLVVYGLTAVPLALLDKELKFRKRAAPEVSAAFTYAAVSITLAAMGMGVWSMVIGWTAMVVVNALVVWAVSPWRPALEFCAERTRVIVNYGKHLVMATLAAFIFLQVDKAAVGKWIGVTAVGFYSVAFTVCNMPATNLTAVVNRVMFPTYSRLSGDLPEMRKVYVKTMRYLASLAFPAAAALMVLAGPAIHAFYGQKWEGAIPLFHILALYGLIRALGATTDAVFMALGRPGLVRRVSWIQLGTGLPLVYPAAMLFGVRGVAWLFTAAYLIGTSYGIVQVRRILDLDIRHCLSAVSAPAFSAVAAGLVALLTGRAFPDYAWHSVAVTGVALACVYGVGVYALDRSMYSEIRAVFSKSGQGELV